MLNEKVQDALNAQVAAENYSANLYLAMSAYLESIDLPGAAKWMKVQSKEELAHGEKIFDYVIARDGRAEVRACAAPPVEWSSLTAVFEGAYAHEQKVTKLLWELLALSRAEGDYATDSFLRWFIDEQVEEEANVKAVVQRLKMVGDAGQGLFMADHELGARTPSTVA